MVDVVDGWIVTPYGGRDLATVEMAVVERSPAEGDWRPAFMDTAGGVRVVQVRPPKGLSGSASVWLRVGGGAPTSVGTVRL